MPSLSYLCSQNNIPAYLARNAIRQQHPEWLQSYINRPPIEVVAHRGRGGWRIYFANDEARTHFLAFLRAIPVNHRIRRSQPIQERERPSIMIGADPEWELRDSSNHLFPAHRLLGGTRLHTKIGTDGYADIGEFRPNPGTSEEVFNNISRLIVNLYKKIKTQQVNLKLYAGAGKVNPTGGHIHFSGRRVSPILLIRLDEFISGPLNMVSKTARRRINTYGQNSSWRSQPHGWEYRTPLSWLTHPVITKGVLVIAYWLIKQSDKDLENISSSSDLLSAMPGKEKDIAQEFYDFLKGLKKPLEEIEVFAAWEIGKQKNKKGRGRPLGSKNKKSVQYNLSDFNMSAIANAVGLIKTKTLIRFIGASNKEGRKQGLVLFVPSSKQGLFTNTISGISCFTTVFLRTWELPSFGLSHELRENIQLASEVVRAVIKIEEECA